MTAMTILMQAGGQQGGGMQMIVMMVVIFAIMWFFMIRPQQKKQKEIANFRNSIAEGTQVVTAGGIYGTVKTIDVEKNQLTVEIAKDVRIKIDRNSVFASAPEQQAK